MSLRRLCWFAAVVALVLLAAGTSRSLSPSILDVSRAGIFAGEPLRFSNPEHGFETLFDAQGVHIVAEVDEPSRRSAGSIPVFDDREARTGPAWSLRLERYGWASDPEPAHMGPWAPVVMRIERGGAAASGGLREWYVNGPFGLEQGFTALAPPPRDATVKTSDELVIELRIDGDWSFEAGSSGDDATLSLTDATSNPLLRYGGLVAWDATGRQLDAQLRQIDVGVAIHVDATAADFPLTIDPFVYRQLLLPFEPTHPEHFGTTVDLRGSTGLVGVPQDNIGGVNSQGSAYVFERSGPRFRRQQVLTAADGATNDFFGNSVAIQGDTAIIGAPGDDIGASSDRGAAYVFTRSGVTWSQQQKLVAADGAAGDNFGGAIAIDGETAIITARFDDSGRGSAYVFTRSGGVWSQQQKLVASDGVAGDWFGFDVALDGATAVVGAPLDEGSAGSAFVFTRSGNTWTQQKKLVASDGDSADWMGVSVALDDGTAVAGAPLKAGFGISGVAYVFTGSGSNWTQQQKLLAVGSADFGRCVALEDDLLVAGAPGTSNERGAAFVYTRSGSTWSQRRRLNANPLGADDGDRFGCGLATTASTLLVGARDDAAAGVFGAGSVTVFGRPTMLLGLSVFGGGWVRESFGPESAAPWGALGWLRIDWGTYNSAVGHSRPAVCDVDGDGLFEVVLGMGSYPANGGWLEVLDDVESGYAHLAWLRLTFPNYNEANGETWPACGDVDGDGRDELVVGVGNGGGGWARVFDDAATNFAPFPGTPFADGWLRISDMTYNQANGSTHPAVGDIDGDFRAEIVLGLGEGGGGWVQVFDDAAAGFAPHFATPTNNGWIQMQYPAYNAGRGEIWPALGDLDGDGLDELVLGVEQSFGWVQVLDDGGGGAAAFAPLAWVQVPWFGYVLNVGSTYPAVGNIDGDGYEELIIGLGFRAGFTRGWVYVFDDMFDHDINGLAPLGFMNVGWGFYNSFNGSTRPAIARPRGTG